MQRVHIKSTAEHVTGGSDERETWEYYVVEVAGKRQPNKQWEMGENPLVGRWAGDSKGWYGLVRMVSTWDSLYYKSAAARGTQDSLFKDEPWTYYKKKSSQCTFINKTKTQPAFTVMTRMLIKYWKEIIKWISKRYKAKAAVFSNTLTIGKKKKKLALAWKDGHQQGLLSVFKHTHKVKLLCTVLHDIAEVNCSWLHVWKAIKCLSKKKSRPGSKQEATPLCLCHTFQIFQHTA